MIKRVIRKVGFLQLPANLSGLLNTKTSLRAFRKRSVKPPDDDNIKDSEESSTTTNLINWAMKNNISYLAFSQLLKVLKECGVEELPTSAKDLLRAREEGIKETAVPPGSYIHFGFEKNLKKVISALKGLKLLHQTEIDVSIFIDNLPLSSVTHQGLWTILGSITGFNNNIFLIGAYQGFAKPNNSNLFLTEFVNEAKHLQLNGLEIDETSYKVRIKRVICDAPAKVFVLNVKSFLGYSSCTKCNAVGEYKKKKICFPEKSTLRSDKDFENDNIYQSEKTKLLEIPNFGLVTNIPLDYLHLVCLGVVKKLITIWLSELKYWTDKESCSKLINTLPPLNPCDFQVKPKPLTCFLRWTPFEFRQFLLYNGPVVLKNFLKEEYYNHFLSLHVACRLLCGEDNKKFIKLGDKLLNEFVNDFGKFYGKEHITHNVHGLYHLANDCSYHGTLDSFSAFPFERFLVQLRNTVRKLKRKPLPKMILRHSYENVFLKNLKKLRTKEYRVSKRLKEACNNHPEEFKNFYEYETLLFRNTEIVPSRTADKYVCLIDGKVIEVTAILGRRLRTDAVCFVAGKQFRSVLNFYDEPIESKKLNVFRVGHLSDVVNYWSVDLIDRKCMKVPLENESVLIGLLHEDY